MAKGLRIQKTGSAIKPTYVGGSRTESLMKAFAFACAITALLPLLRGLYRIGWLAIYGPVPTESLAPLPDGACSVAVGFLAIAWLWLFKRVEKLERTINSGGGSA